MFASKYETLCLQRASTYFVDSAGTQTFNVKCVLSFENS